MTIQAAIKSEKPFTNQRWQRYYKGQWFLILKNGHFIEYCKDKKERPMINLSKMDILMDDWVINSDESV